MLKGIKRMQFHCKNWKHPWATSHNMAPNLYGALKFQEFLFPLGLHILAKLSLSQLSWHFNNKIWDWESVFWGEPLNTSNLMGTYLISFSKLTVVLVRWFLCTRLTFWKLEKLSKLKDLVDRTDTDDPEETEDTPEIMSKHKWENRNNEFLALLFFPLVFMRICTGW